MMRLHFLNDQTTAEQEVFECPRDTLFQSLLARFVRGWSELTVTHLREEGVVAISVQEQRPLKEPRTLRCFVPAPEILRPGKRFQRFPEAVQRFADQAGYTVEQEWFEKRANKLGIKWADDFDAHVLPQRSLDALVCSYLSSSAAVVHFSKELKEDERNRCVACYKAVFAFLGKDFEDGFHEEYLIREDRLLCALNRNKKSSEDLQSRADQSQ